MTITRHANVTQKPYIGWCMQADVCRNYNVSFASRFISLHKKPLSTRVTTTMLVTSKNVLFPGHNNLLTTNADDSTLWLSPECQHCSYLVDGGLIFCWVNLLMKTYTKHTGCLHQMYTNWSVSCETNDQNHYDEKDVKNGFPTSATMMPVNYFIHSLSNQPNSLNGFILKKKLLPIFKYFHSIYCVSITSINSQYGRYSYFLL